MASFLLLLLLLLSPPTAIRAAESSSSSSSSSSSRILRAASPPPATPRIAFHPRRRGDVVVASSSSSSSSASTSLLARRRTSTTPPRTAPAIIDDDVRVVVRKKKKEGVGYYGGETTTTGVESTRPPTPEEIRDALGPIGLFASNAIELVVVTVGSYVSGGILGYVLGGMMGAPSALFGKGTGGGGMLRRLSELHARAMSSCGSWATLSASFTGCNNLVRLCRGDDVDDGWNAVLGSALAGAFLNRSGGMEAMIRGGATYAGFTYVLDRFFKSPTSTTTNSRRNRSSSEFMCTDLPLDDDYDDGAF